MEHKKLQNMFGIKVFREFDDYKRETLRKHPEEIFNQSFKNDCYVNFYEYLLSMSERLTSKEMQCVIFYPDFLDLLFDEWIRDVKTDSSKLEEFIYTIIQRETKNYLEAV